MKSPKGAGVAALAAILVVATWLVVSHMVTVGEAEADGR